MKNSVIDNKILAPTVGVRNSEFNLVKFELTEARDTLFMVALGRELASTEIRIQEKTQVVF